MSQDLLFCLGLVSGPPRTRPVQSTRGAGAHPRATFNAALATKHLRSGRREPVTTRLGDGRVYIGDCGRRGASALQKTAVPPDDLVGGVPRQIEKGLIGEDDRIIGLTRGPAYLDGGLLLDIRNPIDSQLRDAADGLRPEETAVLAFLRTRVARDVAADAATASRLPDRRTRAQTNSRSDGRQLMTTRGQDADVGAMSA